MPHGPRVLQRLSLLVLVGAIGWVVSLTHVRAAPSPIVGGGQQAGASSPTSVNDGVFTTEQAARGDRMYQGSCSSCHTVELQTGRNFFNNWGTLDELYDVMAQTMPDGAPGSLEPADYASVIAFFLRETGYPAGQQELPSTLEALKKIKVEPPQAR
jgi:mono/diheme cytochrome c family protein